MTQSLMIVGAAAPLIKLEKKSSRGKRRALFETPMEMKTIHGHMLLIVTVWTRLHLLLARPIWSDCGQTEYINGSDFQRNVIQVLESLSGNASTSGFNTRVEGQNINSTVYGFIQCRGDLNSSDCKACASTAKENLLEKCGHNTSGFVYLNGCFLRYENHNFSNDYNESNEFTKICNNIPSNQPDVFANITVKALCNNIPSNQPDVFANITVKALSKLIAKTVRSHTLFATDKFETGYEDIGEIYSIAQCWNLSPANCRSCLAAGGSNISGPGRSGISIKGCESGALGARYLSMNCFLQYENHIFFNTSIIASPHPPPVLPPPPPREIPPVSGPKKSKVLGITLGVLVPTLGLIAVIGLWKWNSFSGRKPREPNSRTRGEGEIDLSPSIPNPELIFKYDILREAASNFNEENKLGQGGFGSVFKGVLPDAREVAIKRLNIDSRQGHTEFLNEANLISRVQHKNLVKLLGCSVKNSERLLVYEYLHNSSLDKILFDRTKRHLIDWRDRYEIIVGTARGLAYLHEESEIRIIHRDSNILLDNKYRPKIADFGLAKLFGEDQSHVSTRIAGTFGYMAPEYALCGQLTEKADVFSFGVVVLEIISGRKNQSMPEDMVFLPEETWRLYKKERALEVIDPTLEGSYSWEEAMKVIKIALLCTQGSAMLRPSMSLVVSILTSEREHLPSPTRPVSIDVDNVTKSHQLQHSRVVDPDKASNTRSDIHSAAAESRSFVRQPGAQVKISHQRLGATISICARAMSVVIIALIHK